MMREQYNLKMAWFALVVITMLILVVIKFDIKEHSLANEGVNPDEL